MSKLAKFRLEALNAHNSYRQLHGVEPLEYDIEMESSAQAYAEELAEADQLVVSSGASLGVYGENISRRTSSSKPKPDISGAEVTTLWYRDIEKFDYAKGTGMAGNFTQLVWRDTRLFGIGKATAHGRVVVVAHYSPAGNVRGQFLENVPPPVADQEAQLKRASALSEKGVTATTVAADDMSNYRVRAREVNTREVQEGRAAVVVRRELVEYEDTEGRTKQKLVEERHPKPARGDDNRESASSSNSSGAEDEEHHQQQQQQHWTQAQHPESMTQQQQQQEQQQKPAEDAPIMSPDATPKGHLVAKRNPAELHKFAKLVTTSVNQYRKRHDAKPLRLSSELSDMAQQLSEELAVTPEKLRLSSTTFKGQRLGQSLAARVSAVNTEASAEQVVGLWYAEGKRYNFQEEPVDIEPYGNFTQLVWKSSQDLGVGRCTAQLADGSYKLVVVCFFYPTGNVSKEFLQNVLPQKK